MFQDEGRFELLGKPRRCCAAIGVRPVGARLERKCIYAFVALSPHNSVTDNSLVLPWVGAQTMFLFI